MYMSVCRACQHFTLARRSASTVSPCQECGGTLRDATLAELDTFGQGMTAHTRRNLTVGAAVTGAGEGSDFARLAAKTPTGERLSTTKLPVLSNTQDEVWLECALKLLPTVIARLPLEERQVLIGYYFDQRSVAELAETYGLEQQGTASLLQSAFAHLRKSLR